jgi:hypothetical protein
VGIYYLSEISRIREETDELSWFEKNNILLMFTKNGQKNLKVACFSKKMDNVSSYFVLLMPKA